MSFADGLKRIYFRLEDKYYDFLDWVEDKGVPIYKLVDAVESKNIPSFPVAIIVLVLLAFLIYSVAFAFFPPTSNITLQVFDQDSNPVSGAIATLNFLDKSLSQATSADGKALFAVPLSAQLSGNVKKTGFKDQSLNFVAEKTEFTKTITMLLEINVITKTIQLLDKSSGALLKKDVSLLFNCSENIAYSKEKATNTGTILLDDIPNDCGTLIATPTSGFAIEQGNIDLSQGAPQLKLSEIVVEKGTVKVFLKDKLGNPVAGVTVKLMRSDAIQQSSKPSSTAGSVQFDEVPVGNYYIRTYDGYNAKFADFDSSVDPSGIKQLSKDDTIEFNISLTEKVVGKIKVLVKDKATGAVIPNAAVSLFRDNVSLSTQSTNAEGKVEFAASENSGYSVKVDHQSYLIEFRQGISPSDSFVEILLTASNSSNILSLQVSVVDQKRLPVENARLALKKLDGTVVSDAIATGTDGNAVFERIPADTYYVYAVKDGFEGVNSAPITIAERQLNNLTITMSIGSGTIELSVVDDELKPVQGAVVKLVNSFNMKEIERGNTNAEGKKVFSVRADKKVFFVASAEGYLDYTTIPAMPETGNTVLVEIKMVKDVTKLSAQLLGLFVDKDLASESLSAGQKYTARLQLRVPANANFTEAGIQLRTGKATEGKTNTMEADSLYISKVNAAANAIIKSTTFTPPSGYATDSKQLTSGNAKWANIIFNKPNPGVYDIEAEIIVKENAQLGSILEIAYRGWGKATTYLRDPRDMALGESETAGGKQALYANSYKQVYSVGPSSLCNESFCYYFSIEDLDQELVTSIIDSYDAKMSGNYKLLFTIVSKEETEFSASELELGNDSAGLKLGDYVITGADGKKLSGTSQGNLALKVGDIRKNSSVQGELLFRTMKEGLNKLKISIKSQKENVFSKAIDISVSAASEMTLEMLPKIIVPFVDNDIMLHVTDSKSGIVLAKAAINISLDNTQVFSGETDSAGTAHFTLQSPNANELLRIEVTKNGYNQLIKELRVTENILTVMPEEISELLTTTGIFSTEKDIHLRNDTTMNLQIDEFQISNDFKGLAKVSLKENYVGTSLQKDIDKNIFLKIELTEEGKRAEEITSLEGMLSIFVSSSEMQKAWAVNIPIKIRIGFGNEVSNADCLTIEPIEWNAYTGRKQTEQRFALKNNCKIDKTAIALRIVQIKVDYGNESSLGEFVATSTLSNSETIKLTNTFTNLAPMIGAGEEAGITITFTPDSNVVGGESKPKIIVKAINQTENGPEELLAKTSVNLKINDLAQCIEIKRSTNLRIDNCPYGTGYGNYQNYGYGGYGYMGNTASGQGNYGLQSSRFASPYQYGDTAFAGYPEQMYAQNYPYSGFSEPYYASQYYGGNQYQSNWQCGTTRFAIANNCASRVQIDLETSPELMIEQQTFDLEPNEEKEVTVEASYFIGTYPIDVKAKTKESKEKSTSLSTLYVTVQMVDDPSQFRDCIKLNTTKFQFNDLIQKPVTGKVFNTCFAQGVRLDFDSVRFSQSAYGEKVSSTEKGTGLIENLEVIDLSTQNQGGNNITQVLEFEIYKNLEYRRQEGFPRSGTPFAQLGNIRVFGTGAYFRVEAPAIIIVNYTSSYGGAQSKRFSVTIEDAWNILGTLEGMNVYGCSNIPAQKCIMENALEFGGVGEECMNAAFGNDNYYESEPRDIMRVGECSPEASYNTDVSTKAAEIYAQNKGKGMTYDQALQIAKSQAGTAAGTGNVCGTADTISFNEGFDRIDQDGVVITFEFVASTSPSFLGTLGGKHSIRVSIDRSKSIARCIDISKNLSATVYRQTPLGAQNVQIPFHIKVQGIGIETISGNAKICADKVNTMITTPADATPAIIKEKMKLVPACSQLKKEEETQAINYIIQKNTQAKIECTGGMNSGEKALTDIEFSRLPFSWRFEKINAGTCDKGGEGKYCDAVQNLVAITKKTKDIKQKIDVDGWKSAMEAENKDNVTIVLGITNNDAVKDLKNIFRWAFKQANVNDNRESIFFLDSDGKILSAPIKASGKLKEAVDAASKNSSNLDLMDAVFREIENDSKLSKDIVVEIEIGKPNGITDKSVFPDNVPFAKQTYDIDFLDLAVGADSINNKLFELTFEEFKQFHEAIKKACGSWSDCAKSDKIATVSIGKFTASLDKGFFNRFLNSVSFKRGIRDTAELTIDSEDAGIVIKNAGTIGITREEFNNFWKDVNSTVYLARDGYNEFLQNDFKTYYTENRVGSDLKKIVDLVANPDKVKFNFGTVPQTKVNAGIYTVFLNYNFATQNMTIEMKNIGEPEAGIINNWFLYNPIDGMVGESAGRTGYGTTFGGGNKDIVLAKDGDDEATNKVTAIKGTGIASFTNVKIDGGFETIGKGTILNATGAEFNYSPSTAFKIEMLLTGMGNKTAAYEIKQGATTISGKPLLNWDAATEKYGMQCGANSYYGVETAAESIKAPFFVPASAQYVLNLWCAKEKAALTATEISIGQAMKETNKSISSTTSGQETRLFMPLDGRTNTIYELKQFLDAVESGLVCISSTENSLKLAWNPAKIIE